jgi:hypothetical protein
MASSIVVLHCTKENNLKNVVYFTTITQNLYACIITKEVHNLSHCKPEVYYLNIMTGEESLFHHSDSKSKKCSTVANKEAGQNKVLSQ